MVAERGVANEAAVVFEGGHAVADGFGGFGRGNSADGGAEFDQHAQAGLRDLVEILIDGGGGDDGR